MLRYQLETQGYGHELLANPGTAKIFHMFGHIPSVTDAQWEVLPVFFREVLPVFFQIVYLFRPKGQAWWHTPAVPALGRQKQEDRKFEAS